MLQSQCFHFFGTAEYIQEQSSDIFTLRKLVQSTEEEERRPILIWEPHAKSCRPDSLQTHLEAAKCVDVFSPNHEELANFFDEPLEPAIDKGKIERQARLWVDSGIGPSGDGCMLVRAADRGCLVMSRGGDPVWLPSWYASNSHIVVDATGAGNAFLGAFAIGLQETGSYVQAAKYGQVAASFVIEQVGLPVRFHTGEKEMWNSCSVRERLAEYQWRTSSKPDVGGRVQHHKARGVSERISA